jgi:hypothetical protein
MAHIWFLYEIQSLTPFLSGTQSGTQLAHIAPAGTHLALTVQMVISISASYNFKE